MDVRLTIDDAFLQQLQDKIGDSARAADVCRDAMTLFNWAVNEAAAGRVVLSTNETGEDVHRLVMPALTLAESRAKSCSGTCPQESRGESGYQS